MITVLIKNIEEIFKKIEKNLYECAKGNFNINLLIK